MWRVNRVEERAGVVVAQEFLTHPPRKDLLIFGNDDRADRTTRVRGRAPLCLPRAARRAPRLVHRSVAAAELHHPPYDAAHN
jgi:hypothetical protein